MTSRGPAHQATGLTPLAAQAVSVAAALAERRPDRTVATGDLLVGLHSLPGSVAREALERLGVSPPTHTASDVALGPPSAAFSPDVLRILKDSHKESTQTGAQHITTGHVLLSLLRADTELAADLAREGAAYDDLCRVVRELISGAGEALPEMSTGADIAGGEPRRVTRTIGASQSIIAKSTE